MEKISMAQCHRHRCYNNNNKHNHKHHHHHQSEALQRDAAVTSVFVANKIPGVKHKGPIIFT